MTQGYPPAPPQQKNNTVLYVVAGGIGCALLVVIGAVVIVFFGGFMVFSTTASPTPVATAVTAVPAAPAPAAGGQSAICAKAEACCRKLTQKTNGSASTCDAWRNAGLPDSSCTSALSGYEKGMKAYGLSCD